MYYATSSSPYAMQCECVFPFKLWVGMSDVMMLRCRAQLHREAWMEVKYAIAAFCFWFFAFVNRYLNGIIILYSVVGSCVRYIQCECSILVFGLSTIVCMLMRQKHIKIYFAMRVYFFSLNSRLSVSFSHHRLKIQNRNVYSVWAVFFPSSHLHLLFFFISYTIVCPPNCDDDGKLHFNFLV